MKKLGLVFALCAFIATPAFAEEAAKTHDEAGHHGHAAEEKVPAKAKKKTVAKKTKTTTTTTPAEEAPAEHTEGAKH